MPALPIPQPAAACTGLFNDGNLISLHCTSDTSHPCKNQSELAGGGAAQPAFAPACGSDWERCPGAAFRPPPRGQNAPAPCSGCIEVGADLCRAVGSRSLAAGRSGIRYEVQMRRGSGGRCGCLWPPASFPSSQAKSRACYQEQKMCHLCCISFPFLHLFPARCASEITALRAVAGARGRQRPRQPYRCLAGRKEIRKFAEIFGQQNKHFSCQEPNRQLRQPAAICTAPLAAAIRSTVPKKPPQHISGCPSPRGALNVAVGGGSGDRDPSTAPSHGKLARHDGRSTQGASQTLEPVLTASPTPGVGARTRRWGRGLLAGRGV